MSTNVKQRESQVAIEVTRQRSLATDLTEIVSNLEERLAEVICEPEESPKPLTEVADAKVPLARAISSSNDSVVDCICRLKSLLNRLEL
jgi:hypothetical protein